MEAIVALELMTDVGKVEILKNKIEYLRQEIQSGGALLSDDTAKCVKMVGIICGQDIVSFGRKDKALKIVNSSEKILLSVECQEELSARDASYALGLCVAANR